MCLCVCKCSFNEWLDPLESICSVMYIINVPCLFNSMQALTTLVLIQAFFRPRWVPYPVVFNVSFSASSLLGGSVLCCSVVAYDHVHSLSSLLMRSVKGPLTGLSCLFLVFCQREVCCQSSSLFWQRCSHRDQFVVILLVTLLLSVVYNNSTIYG